MNDNYDNWIPANEHLPDTDIPVIAYFIRRADRQGVTIRAAWVAARTIESDQDGNCEYYDEDTDTYYIQEGWYELLENYVDFGYYMIDGEVMHWMPLPNLPIQTPTNNRRKTND